MGLIAVVGLIADTGDTIAVVVDVPQREEGSWGRLGGAAVGRIPGIGDGLKGGARIRKRL